MKKLSNNNGVIKSSTLGGQRELLREYRNKTNEIIDVLTEQQKEIKKGDLLRMQMIANLSVRINQIEHNVGLHDKGCNCQGVPEQPYTAMRSTGIKCDKCPHEYCVCEEPRIGKANTDLGRYCFGCDKPIKPQEDVKEKLMDYLKKINNPYSEESFAPISEQADKILAIVKG